MSVVIRGADTEVYDFLLGRKEPELGGSERLVSALGLNYYPHNQWYFEGSTIPPGHHAYRPFADLLQEYWQRFKKPPLIAETGAEGSARSAWLHYLCDEVRTAIGQGVPVHGICLYPVTAYAGWDDGRHCDVGLLGAADSSGSRALSDRYASEVRQQMAGFAAV